MEKAADLASKVFKKCMMRKVETVVDEDLKITHEAIAEEVDGIISNSAKIKEVLKLKDVSKQLYDIYF